MLTAITMVSAVSDNTTEKKESPLYKFRAERANEIDNQHIRNSITRFLNNRLYFLPRVSIEKSDNELYENIPSMTEPTCLANPAITCFILCK